METVNTPAAAAARDVTIGMDDDDDVSVAVPVAFWDEAKADASEEGTEALFRRSNERRGPDTVVARRWWWMAPDRRQRWTGWVAAARLNIISGGG